MASFFLVIIYLAFISLGLPDSLLGSAWPVMRFELNAGLDSAGVVSVVITVGTIVSSLLSYKIINRFGTGRITFFSTLATAAALLGFSAAPSFIWLMLFAIPLGLGAGSVDAGLNNYVALHYKPYHMSWLHCFWGVGATMGPIIMAHYIGNGGNWRGGYGTISLIQFSLAVLLFLTLPLWNRIPQNSDIGDLPGEEPVDESSKESVFKIRGLKLSLTAFLFYCAAETTTGLWGSSFLVNMKDLSPAAAARCISLYYAGITVGRLLTGFFTIKVSSKVLIRTGQIISFGGAVLLLLPLRPEFSMTGLTLIGLGFAPVFPCMLHETPYRFGKTHSQQIMGLQMAFAYTGSMAFPPVTGFIGSRTGMQIFPVFLAVYIALTFAASEWINSLMRERAAGHVKTDKPQ